MKHLAILTLILLACCSPNNERKTVITSPPNTPIKTVIEEYWGHKVEDPYRFLENLKSDSVQNWFKTQAEYTNKILSSIPGIEDLRKRVKELYESSNIRAGVPLVMRGKVFFVRKFLEQEQEILYYQTDLHGEPIELLDAKSIGDNGYYSISYFEPSPDGKCILVGVSKDGSEDALMHIINVESQEILDEKIERSVLGFSAWSPDGNGFYYSQLKELKVDDPPSEKYLDSRVKYHVLGDDPKNDKEYLSAANNPNLGIERIDFPFVQIFPGSDKVFGLIVRGTENEFSLLATDITDIRKDKISWTKVFDMQNGYSDMGVFGDNIFVRSAKEAPRYRLEKLNPFISGKSEIVIDNSETVIEDLFQTNDGLYIKFIRDGISELGLLDPETNNLKMINLPFKGSLNFNENFFYSNSEGLFFEMTSWNKGQSIYYYDQTKDEVIQTNIRPSGPYDFPENIKTEEVLVKSHDGVQVPLSIIYSENLKKDGTNPTLLTGYGAYGISITPFFDPLTIAWLEQGGIYAVAHVRGGGEYGKEWYLAGKKTTKPNTWKDFIACAEYLIDNGYTSSDNLAGMGTSAGGILIGRAITERPDLFKAAIPRVGVMNAVRFENTLNAVNTTEFGTVKDSMEFLYLKEMDAYLSIKENITYPAQLITAGINDPRVTPWQPGKFAARMQTANKGKNIPVLLNVEFEGGHGIGSSSTQIVNEWGDIFGFLLWQLGHPDYQIK